MPLGLFYMLVIKFSEQVKAVRRKLLGMSLCLRTYF